MKPPKYDWVRHLWLPSGCATLLICLFKSVFVLLISGSASTISSWLSWLFAAVVAYITADLATGIYHWAMDNYGTPETPIFGSQVVGFQRHHHQPWVISTQTIAYNCYIPAVGATVTVLPVTLLSGDAVLLAFVGVFAGCVMFTQQFHAWAHTPKGKLPPLLAALQDAGIMLPRAHHAAHHRPPFDGTYCTVSGVWNGVLDRWRVFTAVEVVIFRLFGCRPRSWAEPDAEWTQKTQLDDGMD